MGNRGNMEKEEEFDIYQLVWAHTRTNMQKIGYLWTKILGTKDRVEERIENLCYAGNFGKK